MPIPSLMPSVPSPGEHARPALTRFNVVLANEDTAEAVVLDSAPDADQATIAFHQARQRLIHERVRGELVIVQHNRDARLLLRRRILLFLILFQQALQSGLITSFVGAIRDSGRLRDEVSTVDNAETILGWVAMILGLETARRGIIEHYGFRDGADRSLPQFSP